MARPTREKTELIRTAIEIALSESADPTPAIELVEHPDLVALGATVNEVSQQLFFMHKKIGSHIKRVVYPPGGNTKWAYYDRRAVNPFAATPPEPAPEALEAPSFEFNALDVPDLSSARSVTLEVGGVKITIELVA